jgi:stearoyl-CoA 9-desaturase NADPH oxidoreductase
VAERGAPPKVPKLQRRVLNAVRAFTSPLLPDDYLELINPLWSTRELRGMIESIDAETPDAATVTIRPGYEWEGHEAGQYLRIGLDINGRRHWRAYSLTSDPGRPDGFISITIKNVDEGTVSPYLVRRGRPGSIVSLGGVEGEFVLPDPLPEKLLFISAGSGITPIMSMLRSLEHQDALGDVLLIHSARNPDDVIFGEQLREMEKRNPGFRLHEQLTGDMGRFKPADLEELCPDWKEREAFISGPAELLDALDDYWDEHGDCDCLHMERFQPIIGGDDAEQGEGGTIKFLKSDCEARSDGSQPILVAGEEAGLSLPFGCREGICHTCIGKLCSGRVRDLRNGKIVGQEGEMVRTCINAPEGPIEIAL